MIQQKYSHLVHTTWILYFHTKDLMMMYERKIDVHEVHIMRVKEAIDIATGHVIDTLRDINTHVESMIANTQNHEEICRIRNEAFFGSMVRRKKRRIVS